MGGKDAELGRKKSSPGVEKELCPNDLSPPTWPCELGWLCNVSHTHLSPSTLYITWELSPTFYYHLRGNPEGILLLLYI